MEAETIIYYHPVTEQIPAKCAAKRHWWQNVGLKEQILSAEDGGRPFTLVDCPVPLFYYRRKEWKPEALSEAMEAVLHRTNGMADVYLHPQIMTLLSEKYADRWETCGETKEMFLAVILLEYGTSCLRRQGRAAVLLGAPEETEWQMEMTWRLLEPYLARINSLLFYYKEMEEVDIWEELADHLEQYSYEYGLVPELVPYQTKQIKERKGKYRSGLKYEGLILDYSSEGDLERLGQDYDCTRRHCIYVDAASCQEKERVYAGKEGQILYVSPLKYLDTMVKNSYDRLVH